MQSITLDQLESYYQDYLEGNPSHLEALEGELISTHGFLYQTADQELILASSPQVRSCCIGSPSKRSQQLTVKGDLAQVPHQVAFLRGEFHLEHTEPPKMVLNQASFQSNSSLDIAGIALGCLLLLSSALIFFKFYKQRSIS